jgi:hypothetical protein
MHRLLASIDSCLPFEQKDYHDLGLRAVLDVKVILPVEKLVSIQANQPRPLALQVSKLLDSNRLHQQQRLQLNLSCQADAIAVLSRLKL